MFSRPSQPLEMDAEQLLVCAACLNKFVLHYDIPKDKLLTHIPKAGAHLQQHQPSWRVAGGREDVGRAEGCVFVKRELWGRALVRE